MKRIDISFSEAEILKLKALVGKTLHKYSHEQFVFTNTVSYVVKFNIDGDDNYLYCFTEPNDYYGSIEDVSVLSFESQAYPFLNKISLIDIPVNEAIEKIIVVNENQKLYENGKQTYDVNLTRGLIIDFGNHQIAFEKVSWMMEEISVRKGYSLLSQFTSTNKFVEEPWSEGITAECTRNTIVLE